MAGVESAESRERCFALPALDGPTDVTAGSPSTWARVRAEARQGSPLERCLGGRVACHRKSDAAASCGACQRINDATFVSQPARHHRHVFRCVPDALVELEHFRVRGSHHQLHLYGAARNEPPLCGAHDLSTERGSPLSRVDRHVVHPSAVPIVTNHRGGDEHIPVEGAEHGRRRSRKGTVEVGIGRVPRSHEPCSLPKGDRLRALIRSQLSRLQEPMIAGRLESRT